MMIPVSTLILITVCRVLAQCVWAGICLRLVFGRPGRLKLHAMAITSIVLLTMIGACDLVMIAIVQFAVVAAAAFLLRLRRGRLLTRGILPQFSLTSLLLGVLWVGVLAGALAGVSPDMWHGWLHARIGYSLCFTLRIPGLTMIWFQRGPDSFWTYMMAWSVGLGLATLMAAWVLHKPARAFVRFGVALLVSIIGVALGMTQFGDVTSIQWFAPLILAPAMRGLSACIPITIWLLASGTVTRLFDHDRQPSMEEETTPRSASYAKTARQTVRYGSYLTLVVICMTLIPPRYESPSDELVESYLSLVEELTTTPRSQFDDIAQASDEELREWTAGFDRATSGLRPWLADDRSDAWSLGSVGSWNRRVTGDRITYLPFNAQSTLMAAAVLARREGRMDDSLGHCTDLLRFTQETARDAEFMHISMANRIQSNTIREIDTIRDQLDAEQTATALALLKQIHAGRITADQATMSTRRWSRFVYGWKEGLMDRVVAITGSPYIDPVDLAGLQTERDAELRLLMCALAIQSYEFERDTLPTSLDQLVPDYLTMAPTSPFTGQPIEYHVDGERFMLRCLGLPLKGKQTFNDIGLPVSNTSGAQSEP